jgi:type VI secretion system protein ImpC
MVDAPGRSATETENKAAAGLGAFIGAITSASKAASPSAGLARIDALIDRQTAEITGHPAVAALAAAWAGLNFLVRRADFRQPFLLELVEAPRDRLAETFRDHVLEGEARGERDAPLGAVLVAGAFANTAPDLDQLARLADDGELLQAPVIASLAADFFGPAPAEVARLDDPGTTLPVGPGFDKWRGLRAKPAARWLVAAWNPFLLASGKGGEQWGDPAWLVGALIARSVAQQGWPTEISGSENGRIDGLDLHEVKLSGGRTAATPLMAPLTSSGAESLAQAGVLALVARPDRDWALCLKTPTVHAAGRLPDGYDPDLAELWSSLPYQLMAARVASALADAKPGLVAGVGAETAAERVGNFLRSLMADTGPGAGASVRAIADPDRPGATLLEIQVKTGRQVLGGVTLAFDVPL